MPVSNYFSLWFFIMSVSTGSNDTSIVIMWFVHVSRAAEMTFFPLTSNLNFAALFTKLKQDPCFPVCSTHSSNTCRCDLRNAKCPLA